MLTTDLPAMRPYIADGHGCIDYRTKDGAPFVRDGCCFDSFSHWLAHAHTFRGESIPDQWIAEVRPYLRGDDYAALVSARDARRAAEAQAIVDNNQPWEEC